MALTKIQGQNIQNYAIDTNKLSNTAVAAFAQSLAPKITTVNVANSAYTVLDDTAVNIGGGYIVVTGTDFQSGAIVLVDTTQATSTTFINSTTLRAEVPAKSAATYNLYVVNPDGGTGIRVNGVTFSGTPTWVTASPLANQKNNVSFGVTLSATGATSYSNTTSLPAGTTLLANGYFYGTVTLDSETVYTFTVRATDAELQDADKTFQVTVTIRAPSALYWWGPANSYAPFNDSRIDSPAVLGAVSDWSANTVVTTGSFYSSSGAVIKENGTLWTWGFNDQGNLGLNDRVHRSSPVQVGSGTNWKKVSTTSYSTVATKTDGTLWAWGINSGGQLAQNTTTIPRSSPIQIGSNTNWDAPFLGSVDQQALFCTKTDNTLWSWGYGTSGETGNGVGTSSSPVQVPNDSWNISNISTLSTYSFVGDVKILIKNDGTLWTWGQNNEGQLGFNDRVYRSSPVQVGTGTNWSSIATSSDSCLAVTSDGKLWGWGINNNGQLGFNDRTNRSSPVQVGSGTTWSKVFGTSKNNGGFFILTTSGTLWAVGRNNGGLGLGDTVNRSSPVQVGTNTNWKSVHGGNFHSMATKTDGTLWAWGSNGYGQLGLNSITPAFSSPIQVGTATNWNLLASGTYQSMSTKTDGTLWLWGRNNYGQLGLGDRVYRSSPIQLGTATNWSKFSNTGQAVAATKSDGTLWTWGYNDHGQLGLGDRVYRSSPVQVGTDTNWSSTLGFAVNFIFVKYGQELYGTGSNLYGNLGLNNTTNRSSPVQIGNPGYWTKLGIDNFTTPSGVIALKNTGTIWFWGQPKGGNSGTNSTSAQSNYPKQIGTLTTWKDIGVGVSHILAVRTDGTLWSWGTNNQGQLGFNDRVYRSSPVQVGSNTTWSLAAGGGYTSGLIKTDGTLWVWGLGGINQRSSPVQLGSENTWTDIKFINTTAIGKLS